MLNHVLPMKRYLFFGCAVVVGALVFGGCSSSTSPPLSAFQPEIANTPDNFQFQATGVTNVSTTVAYFWSNSGTRAKVNQSSAITDGAAVVVLRDAANVEVYRRSLAMDGDSTSAAGVAGNWTVIVTLTNLDGTLNFRAQKQ